MLTRLAACFLSVGLLSGATGFTHAPEAPVMPARQVTKAQVLEALEARRAKNLAAFRAYRKAGVYPHNMVRFGPLNVWIDGEGHLCAAATMLDKDGKHDLVVEIGKTNNQIRLLNVTEGPLMDWILTSGFTLEEIDRIQAPAVFPERDLAAEDARLKIVYAETDAWLVKHAKAGLAEAAKRLMANPALAERLVFGDSLPEQPAA